MVSHWTYGWFGRPFGCGDEVMTIPERCDPGLGSTWQPGFLVGGTHLLPTYVDVIWFMNVYDVWCLCFGVSTVHDFKPQGNKYRRGMGILNVLGHDLLPRMATMIGKHSDWKSPRTSPPSHVWPIGSLFPARSAPSMGSLIGIMAIRRSVWVRCWSLLPAQLLLGWELPDAAGNVRRWDAGWDMLYRCMQ